MYLPTQVMKLAAARLYAMSGGETMQGQLMQWERCNRNTNDLAVSLQNFVENFSEFSAAQRNAGKHVTLMSELSRLVEARTLMTVGHLAPEQHHERSNNLSVIPLIP